MATVTLLFKGQTGSHSADSKREYTAVYMVKADAKTDGPQEIISNASLPAFGSTYSFSGDSDSQATLKSLAPRRKGGLLWEVSAKWSTSEPGAGTGENGGTISSPSEERPEVRITSQQVNEPVEKATLKTDLIRAIYFEDDEIMPCNSAGVPFIPGLERLGAHQLIRITRNETNYPALALGYQDAINSDDFTITSRGLNMSIDERQARMMNIGGSAKRKFDEDYWEMTYEILVNFDGWNQQVADRGVHACAGPGCSDGHGGIVSIGDVQDGQPRVRAILDAEGMPISTPVFLNGKGEPKEPEDDIFWIEYQVYGEAEFSELGL
tara:strand:+ start:777 stop:1745 length:969 start_codon:yes stop_codon:yes gene_type:complete